MRRSASRSKRSTRRGNPCASPYDYLRRANEFLPRQSRLGDPLFIHSFDRMTQALLAEVDRLMALYEQECLKTGYELCDLAAAHGIPIMLTERVVKQMVFVYSGRDAKHEVEQLRETRDAIDAQLARYDRLPIRRETTDPARGDAAAFVAGLWSSINEDWGRLREQVDLAISGRAQDIDLKRVLKIQSRLVETWERLTVVVVRYLDAKYAALR